MVSGRIEEAQVLLTYLTDKTILSYIRPLDLERRLRKQGCCNASYTTSFPELPNMSLHESLRSMLLSMYLKSSSLKPKLILVSTKMVKRSACWDMPFIARVEHARRELAKLVKHWVVPSQYAILRKNWEVESKTSSVPEMCRTMDYFDSYSCYTDY